MTKMSPAVMAQFHQRNYEAALHIALEEKAAPDIIEYLEFKCAGVLDGRNLGIGIFIGKNKVTLEEAREKVAMWREGKSRKGRESSGFSLEVREWLEKNHDPEDEEEEGYEKVRAAFPHNDEKQVRTYYFKFLRRKGLKDPAKKRAGNKKNGTSLYAQIVRKIQHGGRWNVDLSEFRQHAAESTIEQYRGKACKELGIKKPRQRKSK